MKIKHGGAGDWLREHRFFLILVPCILIIIASGVVSGLTLFGPKKEETKTETASQPEEEAEADPEPVYFSHLTGRQVTTEADLTKAATCVMIENSPAARPQSGLKDAGMVYEAVAEGGITRFLAIYQDALPQLIGPVRSVRMYYVQWAKPYNCSIAHVGGATDALNLIRNTANGYRDIDQFFNAGSYWRSSDRYAPHNVYTNAERMSALNAKKGYVKSEFAGLKRAVEFTAPTRTKKTATTVNMKPSSATWNVTYTYDATNNVYLRAHDSGGAHMDKDAAGKLMQNAPNVVVALMVGEERRPNSAYQNIVTTGTGTAHIFQNGEYIAATWTKSSVDSELKFTTADQEEVVLNPGQVWITAVAKSKTVTWK